MIFEDKVKVCVLKIGLDLAYEKGLSAWVALFFNGCSCVQKNIKKIMR